MSKCILALLSLVSVALACQNGLGLDSSSFTAGEDILVSFPADCDLYEHVEDPSSSFLAIYPADTDLVDIEGDANYKVWMWTCGSQLCRSDVDQPTKGLLESTVTFSVETTNEQSWPLAAGSYQVHLVQQLTGQERFSSVAQTPVFVVNQKPKKSAVAIRQGRHLLNEENTSNSACADDWIRATSQCYQEGQDVKVMLHTSCLQLTEEDWFGFFPVNACDDDVCQGEPVIWSLACHDEKSCQANHQYLFKGIRSEEDDDLMLLPAGEYRIALVAHDDDQGEGPYLASLLSERMLVLPQGEFCHVTQRQS